MKIELFPRLAALIVCGLLCGSGAAFASPWAEVGDSQLRSDIDLLEAAGVLRTVTTQWPLPWQSIVAGLQREGMAHQPEAVRRAAERVLRQAHAQTASGVTASLFLDATNRPSPVYGFDGMGRGEGETQASLGFNAGLTSGRLSVGAITQNFRGNRTKLMLDESYLAARLGPVLVYGGYLSHWWGPGQISALQLSNDARPMPQVGIERSSATASTLPVLRWLGPWQLEFLLGSLDGGPRLQKGSYYNALRLTVNPIPGLEIALARTEQFCGTGIACAPLRDYFHFSNNSHSVNNTSDEGGFDIKYADTLGAVPYQVYMQLMNEDYSWFEHSGTSHLFGASLFLPTAGNPVKLTAEYTDSIATHHPFSFGDDIYGFSYTNSTFPDGMRYRGRTLGFSLDDDSTLLSLQGSWSDTQGRFYELSLHHATIGSRHSLGANIVSPTPVLLNMAEMRVTLPWQRFKLDLAGRLQDDQPRPSRGFSASIEAALRVPL
jgi:hypothetical protein